MTNSEAAVPRTWDVAALNRGGAGLDYDSEMTWFQVESVIESAQHQR
ncbi:MAG TPA: hypothetical protein VLG16_00570 [Candidatus Saccharimonadales bacterium]|nr:hypothetical protein [Candidatus Saccharimonadales bacterium]